MKERLLKQGLLIVLVAILHLNSFFSLLHINIVVCVLVFGLVLWKRIWPLLHCALLFMLLSISPLLFFFIKLQLSIFVFLLVFLVSSACIFAIPSARGTLSWVKIGRIDVVAGILLLLTGLLSTAALILWASLSDNLGFGLQMAQGIAHYPKSQVFLVGIPLFALLNALAEEVVFRGVLQQALATAFRTVPTIVLQATAFAAVHFAAGFPNGISGYGMVLAYGVMLGYLRQRTGGMLAPYLSHVVADLVIGLYLCFQEFEIF